MSFLRKKVEENEEKMSPNKQETKKETKKEIKQEKKKSIFKKKEVIK